jgi:hypothetical protein
MKFQSLLFTLLFGFLGFSQSANVYTNSSAGNDLTGDGTSGNPYQTFHKAYQMVAAGGTIYLTGTFDWSSANETGDSQPNGYGITKNLTIMGDSYQTTIIQAANSLASSNRRIFTLGASLTIWNVTLRYGKATYGGAISTSNGVLVNYTHSDIYSGTKALSLYNCSLNNNEITTGTSGFGAAVYIRAGAVIMDKCIVTNNTGVHAINVGGEGNGEGSINATNCYFADNHYYWSQGSNNFDWGGGIGLYDGQQTSKCNGFATNCTFVSNGRAVRPDRCNFTFTNCSFINNTTAVSAYYYNQYFKNTVVVGGGVWVTGTIVDGGSNYISSSNIAFTNPSSVTGGTPALHLDASPGLNSTFNITNTVAINSSSSVLIDAGTSTAHGLAGYQVTPPCTDQRGYLRNGTIDIGAFEYNGITTVPTTTVSGTLTPFNSYANIASTTQSFDVSGANLTANVVVAAPTGFQLSTSSTGTFTSSLTLSHSGGTLANTTVYVRMLSATTPAIANISVTSACTDTKFIQVSGTVIIPVVTASPTTLTGFSSCLGSESAAQSTSISGSNLYTDITVTAPNGYEISLTSNTGYGASLTLTQTGGIVSATTVFVRLKASATAGTYNLNLTAASGSTTNIALTGTMNGNVTTTSTNLPNIFNYTVGATVTALTFTSNYVTTYQWYANTTNSTTGGTAISGATSATYTPPATATELGTKFYYCQATGCNTALSGVATVNVFRTYYSKASSTDFNDVSSWGINTDGTGTAPSAIDNSGVYIIQNGSQLTLSGNATVRALTINTGKLTVSSNTLSVSIFNQNNTELNVTNGGTLEINGGTVSVNGAVYFADGSGLTQTAGLLVLYPNSGTAATSVGGASGTNISFGIGYTTSSGASAISTSANALKFNCTGGTIQIVDPTLSSNSNTVCFAYNGSNVYVTFGQNHTVKFGNGSSTLAGGHANGFLTNFRASGTGYISFGSFIIDVLTGTNRLVINAGSTICVTKNLTVASGEYRQNTDTYIWGDLTNEGTYWASSGTLYFSNHVNGVYTASNIAQTISGNGLFKTTAGTHNYGSVGFNNSSAGGVTFANANTLKSNASYQGTLSGWLTLTNGVIHTGSNTLIHTQPNAVSYAAGGFGPGSTYARLYTTTGTGTSISTGSIPALTSTSYGSYPFVSGNPVDGMKARHFHRSTAALSTGGLISVKYVESPGLTALPSNITESTNTYDVQTNSSWIVTTTATITGNATYCIQNQDGFTTSNSNVIIVRNGSLVGSASGGSSSPMGQRAALTPANQTGTFTLATSSPSLNMTWTGATSTDWATASNWSPAIVPSASNATIPTTGITNYPVATNVTIAAGKTLNVLSGAQLTVSGILTNNGTITIESGATLVQGASSTLAGSGTYNVQQAITGAGSTTPTGRFWYLGSPVSLASSSVYFGNTANVVKKRDEATNAWVALASGTPENLVVGKGYYTQAMANSTINFTGGLVNNGAITISGLTRTAGQNFDGFNLVANPYPSYLDWDAVTKTDVGNTIWYRTASGSTAGSMVFDTYVAGTGGIGTNLNGAGVSNLIPPMQSFWVRVNSGSTTGSLGLSNSMRAHFTSINGSTAGLKSTSNERDLFLRMNLLQADKKDQLIVYVNGNATNGFDVLDGEKMMQAGMPQFYTSAAGKKITINGLNSAKKQQALPITMELPTTGVHSFFIEDLEISNGLVWLEDKQEEIMQALEPGTVYEFYANSGINAERFVLHFQLIDNTTPINVYNEVNSSANFSGKGASVHAESAGVVVIKLPASTEGITDIQIRDAAGRLVYTGSTNTLETSVQLEQANGIYYVTLNSASGVEVRKVFIQQ